MSSSNRGFIFNPLHGTDLLDISHENYHRDYDDTLDDEVEDEDEDEGDIVIIYQINQNLQTRGVHCTKHVRVYMSAQKGY